MTPAPYDPSAAVAEFDRFNFDALKDSNIYGLKVRGEMKNWLRAALVAAYEAGCRYRNSGKAQYMDGFAAGKREAYGKALACIHADDDYFAPNHRSAIKDAARADGVEL